MGSSSSKFRKHLSNGDEVAAIHLYNNNSDLRKGLDPNCSYGDSHNHDTPLHYASKHGMKSLLRIFLHDHSGNPNKTNAKKQTSLHCICMEKSEISQFYPVQRKRRDCLTLLLKWRGASLKDGEKEKVDLAAIDEENNTALHYAAASGLKHCVETLVQFGAPLFMENNDQLTPCDSAEKGGHGEIALFLESKMVFCNVSTEEEGEGDVISIVETEEYSGLRTQDLQEAKDQLLVETADMLCVPLFTAEALLRNHEWSREMLLEAWMSDALACCNKSGVIPPPSLYCDKPQVQESLVSPTKKELAGTIIVCDICTESFKEEEDPVHMSCDHQFCRCCWGGYLDLKIQEGDAHHITCPAYQCDRLVPVELIENIVSRDMARRYLQFDIEAFVDSNPNIKWCPYPACGRAVKLPELEDRTTGLSINKTLPSDTSRAVDCGNGHYFCWDCMGDAHEPSSCENWTKWYKKIAEIRPEEMDGTEEQTMTAANCLWLVTNSKPCPNCKSPIQKNEGCNHMKCSKCKHDFCWVCLDQWKRHNSSTGGYFKCNRYEAVKVVQEQTQKAQTEAEDKNLKMQELNKFVHYYTRFKNHENSFKLEEPLLNTTKSKMMKLAEAVTDVASANAETQFVEHAVQQLLKARRVLKCSYVYGYYLDGPGYKKIVFEFMQTELEECTEILSQMVNRLYLRTPRKRIIEQAQIVQRKRHEFILAISKGLVPPETPPGLRKHRRRRYSMDIEDEELRKAILASIQEVDPANPWIKDASGRHTNVMAVLDWPDSDDSDSDNYYTTQQGRCQRKNCKKPKAKNPRTDEVHQYCSRQCMYEDQLENPEKSEPVQEVIMDEQMDLLRALEMSRLQFLHDQGIITGDRSSISVRVSDSPNASDRSITTPNTNSSDIQFLHDQGIINQSWGSISYRVLDSPNASDISTTTPSTKSPDLQAPLRDTRQKSPRSRQKSPKQKSPGSRQKGKGKGKKSVQAAMEELDLEIQRVLEISSISPSELEASMKMLGEQQNTEQLSNPLRQKSRYDDTSSPCVQSVPNKSVEDLYHDDCLNCIPGERILPTPNSEEQRNALDMHLPSTSGCNPLRASLTSPAAEKLPSDDMKASPYLPPMSNNRQSSSSFGIIKDLSVSNLHVDVNDKTKDFQGKSFNFLMDQRSKSGNSSSGSLRLASFESPKEMEGCEMSDIFLSGDPKGAPTNQKDKKRETMLSVIAANTPGDDEDNLFVLVSPAESHVDHTMSYGSGESQSENAFLSPEEISQSEIPSEELHHGNTDFSNDVWTPMPTYIQDLAEGTGDSTEQFMHMDALNENYQRTVERSQETENVIENLWNTNQNTSDNNNIAQENIEEEESISTNSRNCDRNVYRDQATALSAMSEPFTSNDPITDDDIIDNGVNSLLRSLQLDELSTFSELEDIRPVSDNYGNYERESEVSSSITRRVMPPSDERGEADGAEEERGESFFV